MPNPENAEGTVPSSPVKINKTLLIALAGFILLIIILGGILATKKSSKLESTPIPNNPSQKAIIQTPPTLSAERKEIIAKLQTHVVIIKDGAFSPNPLTVKLHDQVEWQNKDQQAYTIKGSSWGNLPIDPGTSFTQAFETVGQFPYTLAPLTAGGQIIVE